MTEQTGGNVGDLMHRDLEVVPQNETIVAAAERMRARRIGSVLVGPAAQGRQPTDMMGIVTDTDLVRKVIAKGLPPERTTAGHVMSSPLLTISAERPVLDANHLMELNHVRHLCVSEKDRVVGLISVRDIVKFFVGAEAGPVRDLDDVYRPLSILMSKRIEKIDREESVLAAARCMAEKGVGSLLVTNAGEVTAIVTESDVVRNALPYNLDSTATTIGSIGTQDVIDIDINRTIHDASDLMAQRGVRHLAVTENHKIVGILSVRDLIRMISARDRPRFVAQNRKSS